MNVANDEGQTRIYGLSEATVATGATAHQLRHWDEVGLVPASVRGSAVGTGLRRGWTQDDISLARLVVRLGDLGITTHEIRRAFAVLRKVTGNPAPVEAVRSFELVVAPSANLIAAGVLASHNLKIVPLEPTVVIESAHSPYPL